MTIHVLIACSKSKSQKPLDELIWRENTTMKSWHSSWTREGIPRFPVSELYSGRSTRNQLELVRSSANCVPYVISAGAGLINASGEVNIPSYESTIGSHGPLPSQWHELPHGGLSNIVWRRGDSVVAFAPPNYLRAISMDPDLEKISKSLVAPMKSSLGSNCLSPVRIHPRIKEILGVSSADLNTELIRVFLEEGVPGIERASDRAQNLPPLPIRRRVNDEELFEIVKEHGNGKTAMGLVRFIRDDLNISASVERIGAARRKIND